LKKDGYVLKKGDYGSSSGTGRFEGKLRREGEGIRRGPEESGVEVGPDNGFFKKPGEDGGERNWSEIGGQEWLGYFGDRFNNGGFPLSGNY